jgi:DNA-binding IclR family transcriptional regulator
MPTGKQRIERMNEIIEYLKKHKGSATFKEVFATQALKYGLTKNTFFDYLDTLRTVGKIDYPLVRLTLVGQEDNFTITLKE